MASNMLKLYKSEFKGLSTEEVIEKMIGIRNELLVELEDAGFGHMNGQILAIAASIGVSADGDLTENEKKLTDAVFGEIANPLESLYEILLEPVDDKTYLIFENLTLLRNHELNTWILLFIIGFAIIDGKIEKEIEEKLDSVFGLHFLGQFFNSGLESVPVVDDDEDELNEFEEEIVNYFRKNKGILTLEKLAKKFNSIPKGDLKDILDDMLNRGILSGGDAIIDCTYFLEE